MLSSVISAAIKEVGCTAPSSRGILKFVMSSGHTVGCLPFVVLFSLPLVLNHKLIFFFSAFHEFPWVSLQRAVFFFAVGFVTGAGTGRFFQKLLSADALTHPGFSERVPFPLVFADGAIIDISDVHEKLALEPLSSVEHNLEVHIAVYLDFDTVLYLDFQEARPAMSLCFSFLLVSGTFLVLLVVFSSSG